MLWKNHAQHLKDILKGAHYQHIHTETDMVQRHLAGTTPVCGILHIQGGILWRKIVFKGWVPGLNVTVHTLKGSTGDRGKQISQFCLGQLWLQSEMLPTPPTKNCLFGFSRQGFSVGVVMRAFNPSGGRTHRAPASASQLLRLKAGTTTARLCLFVCFCLNTNQMTK